MREIKFSYILQQEETGTFIEKVFDYVDIFTGEAKRFFNEELPRYFIVTKRQYTGLKDKNGKEIYEGDIVRLTYPVMMPEWAEQKMVVKWWDNECKFSISVGDAREVKEIIGNIYENPNLLLK